MSSPKTQHMPMPNMRVPRPKLAKEELEYLYARKDGVAGVAVLLILLGVIFSVSLAIKTFSAWTILPWLFIIGGFQHMLSIVQHEANHFLLFEYEPLNELVGRISAHSIGFTMAYRKVHLQHHRRLGHDDDPDVINYVNYPCGLSYFTMDLAWHLSGLAASTQFIRGLFPNASPKISSDPPNSSAAFELAGLSLVQAAIFFVFLLSGHWIFYFVTWILPLVTVTKTLTHFRNVVEHTKLQAAGDPELARFRMIRCNLIESFFFAPLNFNFHAEHHLYPSIPFYNLPMAHRLLSTQDAYHNAIDIQLDGYIPFLLKRALNR